MKSQHHTFWLTAAQILLLLGCVGLSLTPRAFASGLDVKHLQETLKAKGYDPGPIDGHLGAQTRTALSEYQKANGLPTTGHVDAATAQKLGVGEESEAAPAKGSESHDFREAAKQFEKGSEGFGHEIKRGKPVAATKDFGQGVGKSSVKVGAGVKKAVDPKSDKNDPEQKP
jgi:peptidoglycan hydrolase-like protein with peptidoglycan-binding domain